EPGRRNQLRGVTTAHGRPWNPARDDAGRPGPADVLRRGVGLRRRGGAADRQRAIRHDDGRRGGRFEEPASAAGRAELGPALGGGSDAVVAANVTATTGNVSILGGNQIRLKADVVATPGGTVTLTAGASGVIQDIGRRILADTLSLKGTGNFILGATNNVVTGF